MSSTEKQHTKAKVWVGFVVLLLLVGAAIFWSFKSYNELTNSINNLSRPDNKSALIQYTIQGITKAENHIQSYILTNDSDIYQEYQQEIKRVQTSIDSLKKEMHQDSLQVQRVDSLERLFLQKLSYLDDFLSEKRATQTRIFSSQALAEIEKNTADSTGTGTQILTKVKTTEETRPSLEKEVVETEYKAPGLWEGVKRLFGAKNIRIDTVRKITNDTIRTTEVVIDTLEITNYNPDTMLLKVKEILQEVANQEFSKRSLLSTKELEMLRKDLELSQSIDRIIDQLQAYEHQKGLEQRAQSTQITQNSTRAVLAFGLAGIGIGGIFLFAIGRDLTRSIYLSKRLALEKEKADRLGKMKEEFLANMSHEIRTPLNSILGFSDLIKQTNLNEKQDFYSKALQENTKYLSNLVNDILDFSKLESSKISLNEVPFHLPTLIAEVESLFMLQCQQKGIDLRVTIDEQLKDISLIGDEFRLRQILINLLSNAAKFTQQGHISLKVNTKEKSGTQQLKIEVYDTGKGIAPDKFKSIFKAFEQEDSSITKEFGGTGLGLAIVQQLVHAMGGKITVDSKLNEYTKFTIKVAFKASQTHKTSKPDQIQKSFQLADKHIVLVDDDYWNRALLSTLLNKLVTRVTPFENGMEATSFIESNHEQIDLVLTDISMPEVSGIDLLKKLRTAQIDTPVIAITAHAMPQKLNTIKAEGFDDLITKPFKEESIRQAISQALSMENKPANSSEQPQPSFDFEHIRQFSGDDEAIFNQLVRGLIENNKENVSLYEQFLAAGEKSKLADLAHKMIQTYNSLNMPLVVEALKSIEVYHELKKYQQMVETANQLLPDLQQINDQLITINDFKT
ncbi:signal transduction histidine kinase [Roseivirga pacifica]|uniref:histidine kinase n=1 Tax=Roseivirga pacifica TaxID=1267423 RepID=A0A1I0QNG3_9BACT|nr:ATP-binding protein [Roseivirga pacifica]RKQ42772.1 signal transduction histidine kinase [Roseivirga pacifica]SEW28672.1 Signal transduction histidine kinase [Roseivirga pacifica]